jgi:hypothetical protein
MDEAGGALPLPDPALLCGTAGLSVEGTDRRITVLGLPGDRPDPNPASAAERMMHRPGSPRTPCCASHQFRLDEPVIDQYLLVVHCTITVARRRGQ